MGIEDAGPGRVPFAHESVTVAAAATELTAGTYEDAIHAELTLETAQIRIWVDGTDPTTSEGHIVDINDVIVLDSSAKIIGFKAIRTGGVSGVLKASYFR